MTLYKVIFRLNGGEELKAVRGFVPDEFFEAARHATLSDAVAQYTDGLVVDNALHEKLDTPSNFTSYAVVGKSFPEGSNPKAEFLPEMLKLLKDANHARPLYEHRHYQIYFMEYIEPVPDDDL